MTVRLFKSQAFLLSVGAIVVFLISLIFASYRLVHIERSLDPDTTEDMLWAITQAQFESLRFADSVNRFINGDTMVQQSDVALRYDILRSRLSLFETGEPKRYLLQLSALGELERYINATSDMEPEVQAIARGNTLAETQIRATAQPLAMHLRDLANKTMLRERDRARALRDDRGRTVIELSGYMLGVLLSGAVLVGVLVRSRRDVMRAEESLHRQQELSRMYRTLVSMVTHQFGSPLAVIDSSAQRILRRGTAMSSEEITTRTTYIRDAVSGLMRMMQITLNAARLDEGELSLRPEETDLRRLIDSLCDRYQQTEPERRLIVDTAGLPPHVYCDPTLIEQALSNLISNALKFSGEAAPVRIYGRVEGDSILLSVEDKGVGIPADELPYVFKEFFRARTAESVIGTGIGLSFARNIARLHGGDIEVSSVEGAGSTFTIHFPFGKPPAQRS
ncbi:sensor histidine kinase [Microvirga flavescens]|uniref:sensor histidine kinase n=1 Tax=Microvirga flavescens TaxID=2249811 RepID=UPI000DD88922|nr:HAMP domain-containing sensor histidine kinase [Microvirga flavescens]